MTETMINVKGLDELIGKLDTFAKLRTVKAGLKAGGLHIKSKIDRYPKTTKANQPGPYPKRWYKRGTGSFWARVGGGVGSSLTSETLGRRWTMRPRDAGMSIVVGNNVSYGIFVQGERQASFHKRHNWKTTEMIAKSEGPRVRELIAKAIRAALA